MSKNKELTLKDCRFIEHYVKYLNAKSAAIHAGYSPNNAYTAGNRLLNKPEVKARIESMKKKAEDRTGWSRERMLKELESTKDRAAISNENFNAEIKALETICKIQGYFIPEKTNDVKGYDIAITIDKS